jgi:DNA-binding MarR family transcriptional regulator
MPFMDDPLERAELLYLFGMAFQLLQNSFVGLLDTLGYTDLRPVHGMVFQLLRDGGATSTELAEQIGVTKQAAGQIVAYLEERGYVTRTAHPDGGRRRLVVLTAKARDHLAVAGSVLTGLEGGLAERIGAADLAALRRALAKVVRELGGAQLPPLRPIW